MILSSAVAQDRSPIPLPVDSSTPVITLQYRDGFPAQPIPGQEQAKGPYLTIRADGRGTAGNINFSLSADELQELLHFVIDDQHFFDFDPKIAKADILDEQIRTGRGVSVADAGTTVVRVTTLGKDVESSFNAVTFWTQKYPNARGLKQFAEIEKRLRLLGEKVKATGTQQVR